ncbi:predicted protein, partial [Nematostella vectensis]
VEICPPPAGSEAAFHTLLTPQSVAFLVQLVNHFDEQVDELQRQRRLNKVQFEQCLPDFQIKESRNKWQVKDLPARLQDRRVDLGDITPSNTLLFKRALNSSASGIQADLDDGNCPTWKNQLQALYNVYQFVHGQMSGVPKMNTAPLVILRPRAWNMLEQNIMVGGKLIPGALCDFGLHMFHSGLQMLDSGDGPFFYLPKIEGYREVRLWNSIFNWTQQKLGLPQGSIRACVLIESILASFELEDILFEMRDHCMGLNCGMWDYSASFVSNFGHRKDFILPDRKKYVSMEKNYLKSYMDLVIKTCHAHGCHATGGMVPVVLPHDVTQRQKIIGNVCRAKQKEIQAGADGFLVFDPDLIPPLLEMWKSSTSSVNQLHVTRGNVHVTPRDLLTLPQGGFTLEGLQNNITVVLLFISAWLRGEGSLVLNGAVEDSATAEISRSQIWQAIRHQCRLESDGRKVTRSLLRDQIQAILGNLSRSRSPDECRMLKISAEILEELVLARDFPPFITTYLYGHNQFVNSKWNS